MKISKKNLSFIGLSSLVLLTSSFATAAEMSNMDHSGMDMSGMQGGQPPADARSPDYSNGVPYGQYGKPMMMGSMPLWGVSVDDLGYQFDEDQINFEATGWYYSGQLI